MEGVSASLNEVELKELCDKCIITERSGVDTASDLHVTSHMPGPSDPVTGTSCCGTGHGGHVTGRGGHVTGKSCCGTGHGGHVTDLMLEDGVLTPSSKPSEFAERLYQTSEQDSMGGMAKIVTGNCLDSKPSSFQFAGNSSRVKHELLSSSGHLSGMFSHLMPEGCVSSTLHTSFPPCGEDLDDKATSACIEGTEERSWKTSGGNGALVSDGHVKGDQMLVRPGVSVNTREYKKSPSGCSNSSGKSGLDHCSVISVGSGKHLMSTTCCDWLVDSLGRRKPWSGELEEYNENLATSVSMNSCSWYDCKKELEAMHQSQLREKDLLVESLNDQLKTLRKQSELMSKVPAMKGDSNFEEILNLTVELSGRQEEIGKLKVRLEGYEELKRRSEYLEKQSGGVAKQMMAFQKENADLKKLLSGAEGRNVGVPLHQNLQLSSKTKRLQSIEGCFDGRVMEQDEAITRYKELLLSLTNKIGLKDTKLQELEEVLARERADVVASGRGDGSGVDSVLEEMRSEGVSLKDTLERKNIHVLKLKDRLQAMTVPFSDLERKEQPLLPHDLASLSHQRQSDVEVVEVQGTHADDLKWVAELVAHLEATFNVVADQNTQIRNYQSKCGLFMSNYTQVHSHLLKIQENEAELETKIEDLSADISALNLSLAESDNDKVQLGRQLQEVEKERADLEVKAGRLEQRVAENNALIENLSKDIICGKEQLDELSGQMVGMRDEMKTVVKEKTDLQDELSLHQTRATIFEQDFKQERCDREEAHSRHIEVEEQYMKQMDALKMKYFSTKGEYETVKKRMEENHQMQFLKLNHALGERLAALDEEKKVLESDNVTKRQQMKQYKKLADQLKDDLTVLGAKNKQFEKTIAEMEKYEWQLHMLQKENTKLKAVSAGIGKAETLSSANDKKRITELEEAIAVLKVEIVNLKSQIEQGPSYNKATPIATQAPPVFSNATLLPSKPREMHGQKLVALPNRPSVMNKPTNPKTVDNYSMLQSRGNNARGNQEQAQSGQSQSSVNHSSWSLLPNLNNGGHLAQRSKSQHSFTSLHAFPGRPQHQASNADYKGTVPSSNMDLGVNSAISPMSMGVVSSYPNMTIGNTCISDSTPHYNAPLTSKPYPNQHHTCASHFQPAPMTYGYPANLPPSSIHHSQTYVGGQNGGTSGSSALFHHSHQGQHHSLREKQTVLALGSVSQGRSERIDEAEMVEKDSPPSSMSCVSLGPSPHSLQCANLPTNQNISSLNRKYSHLLPLSHQHGHGFGKNQQEVNVAELKLGLVKNPPPFQQEMHGGGNVVAKSITALPHTEGKSYPLQETTTSSAKIKNELGLSKNRLEMDIDHDIVTAADALKYRAGGAKQGGDSSESAPYDPNLECPTCGLKFKIGQIQTFREHASCCEPKMT